jgi:phosphonate metabolism protein (transferase hexapeptide repeat family)
MPLNGQGKIGLPASSCVCRTVLPLPFARGFSRGEAMRTKTRLSETPLIHDTARVLNSTLGRYTEVGERTRVAESSLGDYSYVVNDSDIIYSTIGKFCSIAAHTRINPGNHPYWRASQAHFVYRASEYFEDEPDEASFFDWRRADAVTLGHDVWVGHGAVILPGVEIGTGAIIAAGAVVTKSVASYQIVGGVPAKIIRRRFAEAVGERLLALSWWDWSHERLRGALPDFRALSVEAFLEKYE